VSSSRVIRPPEISGLATHPSEEQLLTGDSSDQKSKIIYPDFVRQTGIEYPNGDKKLLLPFVRSIENIRRFNGLSKILHYGDSQLEGDRITMYLRARMQSEYGGSRVREDSTLSESGIIVENNSQRGSAGLEFSKDAALLNQYMSDDIFPDLIILQFGINVVPAKANNFDYYKNYLIREIRYIQGQVPGVPILIISVSDMGHMLDGVPTIYSSVEKIARVQREAAKETGTAYFDLLEFMGGTGSFHDWVEDDPPLMRADFTHFTYSGGALMAEGLTRALVAEVEKHANRRADGK
jgi:lysophospholipase L1-like esterase